MSEPINSRDRVLRYAEVLSTSGLKKTTLYEAISKGVFPKPIPLTERTVGWLESEVLNWLAARIGQRGRTPRMWPPTNRNTKKKKRHRPDLRQRFGYDPLDKPNARQEERISPAAECVSRANRIMTVK